MEDEQIIATVGAIRSYLAVRPNATDTADGIHQWWLPWDGRPALVAVTVAALEQLESQGYLEHFQSGSRRLWRRKLRSS